MRNAHSVTAAGYAEHAPPPLVGPGIAASGPLPQPSPHSSRLSGWVIGGHLVAAALGLLVLPHPPDVDERGEPEEAEDAVQDVQQRSVAILDLWEASEGGLVSR